MRAQVKQTSVALEGARAERSAISRSAGSSKRPAPTSPPRSPICARKNALGSLILDLRDDPGGIVDQAIIVADQFLDDGTIVTIRGRKGSVETQTAHKGGAGVGVPIIVARRSGHGVGGGDPGGGAPRSRPRASSSGSRPTAKGTVQTFYDLDDGSGLKLTTARYLTPEG